MHIDHRTLADINSLLQDLGKDLDLTTFSGTMFSAAAIPIFLFLYLSTKWTVLLIPLFIIFALFLYFSFFSDRLKKRIRSQQLNMLYKELLPSLLENVWERYHPHPENVTGEENTTLLAMRMEEEHDRWKQEMLYRIDENQHYRIEKKPAIQESFTIVVHTSDTLAIDGSFTLSTRNTTVTLEDSELVNDPVFLNTFALTAEPTSRNRVFLSKKRRDALTSIQEIAGDVKFVYEKDRLCIELRDFSIFPHIKKGGLPHAIYEEDLQKTCLCLNLLAEFLPRLL